MGEFFKCLGLPVGYWLQNGCLQKDQQRIKQMERKSSEKGKRRSKKLRAIRKGFIDKEKELEGGGII